MHHDWIGRVTKVVTAAVAVVAFSAVTMAAPAGAEQAGVSPRFGSFGEGAGQFFVASGIAIDQETGVDGQNGNVYVVDRKNSRLDEFGGDGEFVRAWGWNVDAAKPEARLQECTNATGCKPGESGSGAGEFGGRAEGVAVDNSVPAGLSHGDVYVVDSSNARVEKFSATGQFILMFGGEVNASTHGDVCLSGEACQAGVEGTGDGQFEGIEGTTIAVDPQGHVYVGNANRVQRFSEGGAYETTVLEGAGRISALAAAPNGDVYVLSSERSGVREYESGGKEVGAPRDENGGPQTFTTNAAGDLFVNDEVLVDGEAIQHILEYEAAGAQIASFNKTPFSEAKVEGVAVGETAEALYWISHHPEIENVRTVPLPSPGPLVLAQSVVAEPKPHKTATLKAEVNPESETEASEYWVEFGVKGSPLQKTAVQTLPASFEESTVTVELSGLEFSSEYDYCFRAKNGVATTPCVQSTFVSSPASAIESESVTDVAAESATLNAEVNPEETPTTCRFEYGTMASYDSTGDFEHVVPASAIVVPENAGVTVSAIVQEGIDPGSEFAYRVVCEKESVTNTGEAQSFRTQSAHREVGLPDARAWELVANGANGAGIFSSSEEGLPEAAEGGAAIAYTRLAAISAGAEGNRAPEGSADMARHGPNGWSSVDIVTPYDKPVPIAIGKGSEYRLFSNDLSAAVVEPWGANLLSAEATERTGYRRVETAGKPLYEPLLTTSDVAEGVKFGGEGDDPVATIEGATPDLTHVAFQSRGVALTSGSPPTKGLYEWSAGRLTPVSVLPAAEGGAFVEGGLGDWFEGGSYKTTRNAVSSDGSLVYWTSEGTGGLYLRDMRTQPNESLRLDVPQAGVVPQSGESESPIFQMASADGSRVLFTDTQRLTQGATANANEPDLYECAISAPSSGPPSCELSDITDKVLNAGESADVHDIVAGANEEGTRVYFVATGVLASGASAGEENLYTAVEAGGSWQVTWIATLSSEDTNDWGQTAGRGVGVYNLSARSSPDGQYFTFMSNRSLTGYDNDDAASGAPDQEVYVYDADSERLSCVSCDPTGARPHGLQQPEISLNDSLGALNGKRLAALLPVWQYDGLTTYLPHQPRYLSDSGRLFFMSSDALVPQASNGLVDVYEYEPGGVGSCSTAVAGYVAATGGCVSLISPGTSGSEAAFLDASANGDDAFVLAAERPAEANEETHSIYDAHSCETGSSWACAPPAGAGPPCSTTESCRSAPPAQPSIYGAPSSATFSGMGNITPSVTVKKVVKKAVKCAKGKTRRKGRCVRVKRGGKLKGKAGRRTARTVRSSTTRRGGR